MSIKSADEAKNFFTERIQAGTKEFVVYDDAIFSLDAARLLMRLGFFKESIHDTITGTHRFHVADGAAENLRYGSNPPPASVVPTAEILEQMKEVLGMDDKSLGQQFLDGDIVGVPQPVPLGRELTNAELQERIETLTSFLGRPEAREAAYVAIDSERDYQDSRWGDTLSGGRPAVHNEPGFRTLDEWVLYLDMYVAKAKQAALGADPAPILDAVRKVAALGVVCMEQHGAPHREGFEIGPE